jgi:hypothetical protein
MFPYEVMFPREETTWSHDLADDDSSSTLRATAYLFESVAGTADGERRDALLGYARLYREMAELSDRSAAEDDGLT